ncbi:DUF6232 family protein [Streptomyces liangshanensis]|uniref:DUF6232 family protein n=1 Tax=Streptomyces liangshanensis TaxID=2717324 RepID=UPI0036DD39D4
MAKSSLIDVTVSQRILTIGSSFYPLQSVARVSATEWLPRRGAQVRAIVKSFFGVLAIWVLAAMVDAANEDAGAVVGLLAIVVTVGALYRAVKEFRRKPFYRLVIETAGEPHTALVCDDRDTITWIAGQIMAAINDPAVHFHKQVNNYTHIGDKFDGDKVGRDKNVSR